MMKAAYGFYFQSLKCVCCIDYYMRLKSPKADLKYTKRIAIYSLFCSESLLINIHACERLLFLSDKCLRILEKN